jgi:hypothetical protein
MPFGVAGVALQVMLYSAEITGAASLRGWIQGIPIPYKWE